MGETETKGGVEVAGTTGHGPTGPRIRCPKCNWQPRADDCWACQCGHVWNTFDTGGVCPGCLHQWKTTQCKACHQMVAAPRLVRGGVIKEGPPKITMLQLDCRSSRNAAQAGCHPFSLSCNSLADFG